ncbi:Wall-associated receptor kinase 5 [Hordeum vulgare]|nr:Wall-associated receptor kinase 5 [Hordeum vulgare]
MGTGHPSYSSVDGTVEVLEISIPTDTVRVNSSSIALSPAIGAQGKKANGVAKYHTWSGFRRGGQFFVSPEKKQVRGVVFAATSRSSSWRTTSPSTPVPLTAHQPRKGPTFSVPPEQGVLRHWLLQCCIPKGYTSYSIQVQAPGKVCEFDTESSVYIAEEGSYNVHTPESSVYICLRRVPQRQQLLSELHKLCLQRVPL